MLAVLLTARAALLSAHAPGDILLPSSTPPVPGGPLGTDGFFDSAFSAFRILFALALLAIVAIIGTAAYRYWQNGRQPVLTVTARCVAKRLDARSGMTVGGQAVATTTGLGPATGPGAASTSTDYFATFQTPDGQRMELRLSGPEYGQLAEGDEGRLTYQGWAFRGFVRGL